MECDQVLASLGLALSATDHPSNRSIGVTTGSFRAVASQFTSQSLIQLNGTLYTDRSVHA